MRKRAKTLKHASNDLKRAVIFEKIHVNASENVNFRPNFVKISKLPLKLLNLTIFTWCETLCLNFIDLFLMG